MSDATNPASDEPLDTLLNPHRAEEQDRVKAAGATRLQALGVHLTGRETSDEIGDMLDGVEEFEQAVESRGGDLMVDEGPHGRTTQPDDPDFVLPKRGARESPAEYAVRLVQAASHLRHGKRHHPG